jgi:predicted nuclease of predicted toxin-antitoxin system
MRFLVDAQLPRRMVDWLSAAGCDAAHTMDLPLRNQTPDKEITGLANREQRILVTKDGDFVDSHLLSGEPAKLLLLTTGNISNRALEQLTIPLILALSLNSNSIHLWELGQRGLVIRG